MTTGTALLPARHHVADELAAYGSMTVSEVDAFVFEHRSELGADGISAGDVRGRLESGAAVLERRPFGFALVEQTATPDGKLIPHLWILYVDPACRGSGRGRAFVRELLDRYSQDFHMSLYCHGARRRAFFGRLGFRVESREGEMRRMTTNDCRGWGGST